MVASGLRGFAERVGDGNGLPRLDAEGGEELMHVQPGVAIALADRPPESTGTLYITTKRVLWLSDTDRARGYAVGFLSLSLHAVSRDPEAYAFPCIYTQMETEAIEDEESEDSDLECNEELDLSKVTEMRLVPSDPGQLDALFDIFCKCAELNPDPNQEQEEENDWIFGDEQMAVDETGDDSEWHFAEDLANPIGHANGGHDLAQSVLELQINDQRFEDADESEQVTQRHPE
uniref:Chloride conductance regulatory protein ICln n=1 Tax=Anthurium amnicola TaxID=1678845 RepID=A0A1D1XLD0_9ARAE